MQPNQAVVDTLYLFGKVYYCHSPEEVAWFKYEILKIIVTLMAKGESFYDSN